jgi:small GTP-binding protein
MTQKKVCTLGAFAVGKTSLVERFSKSIFSDQYHTTVGVRILKKAVEVGGKPVNLILWDMAGQDELVKMRTHYLRGSSGYMLVADGTRPTTLDKAVAILKRVEQEVVPAPFVLVINKADLADDWSIDSSALAELAGRGWDVFIASAKTGAGVEEAFLALAGKIMRAADAGSTEAGS